VARSILIGEHLCVAARVGVSLRNEDLGRTKLVIGMKSGALWKIVGVRIDRAGKTSTRGQRFFGGVQRAMHRTNVLGCRLLLSLLR
jgi:hypothetical protein